MIPKHRYGTGLDIDPGTNCLELHIRGEYVCSWGEGIKENQVLIGALIKAMEYGMELKAKEIRSAIGAK